MDSFKIAKRKKLTDEQKQQLIDDTDSKNRMKETVLQNYFKHLSWDEELVEAMVANGHRLDSIDCHGQTLIHSVINHCRNETKATAKIHWLLKNNAPIESERYSFIDTVVNLVGFHHNNKSKEWREQIIIDIVREYEKNGKIQNLNTVTIGTKHNAFNFSFWLKSVENITYLDTIFDCNYNMTNIIELSDHNYLRVSREFYKNRDTLSYFITKSPDALTAPFIDYYNKRREREPTIPYIYRKLIERAIDNIDIPYRFGFKDDECDGIDHYWNTQIWKTLSNPRGGLNCYKQILIYGLVSGKIRTLPTSFVKIYKLSVDDLKKYIEEGVVDEIRYGFTCANIMADQNILRKHYVVSYPDQPDRCVPTHHLFPEDCPDNAKHAERIRNISKCNGYADYTLERCERDKLEILKFLKDFNGFTDRNDQDNRDSRVIKTAKRMKSRESSRNRKIAGRPGTKRKNIRKNS
jgi:hypothetical protein